MKNNFANWQCPDEAWWDVANRAAQHLAEVWQILISMGAVPSAEA